MTPKEIKRLVKTLRAAGVTHYKNDLIELDLGPLPPPAKVGPETKEETQIPHVVEELVSVMKLSDNELVDRLFPDTQEEPGETEQ